MAYKVLSLGNEAPAKGYKVLSLGNEAQPESFGQQALRTATATGIKGVENLQSLGSLAKSGLLGLGSLFGMEEPHARLVREGKLSPEQGQVPDIAQLLQQKSGYTPEQLQPQNAVENFVQRFGSQAPLAALGGLPGLASTAIGSGVASGLGALGAPEGLQDIAQLGSEIGYGISRGRIPTAGSAQKAAYEKALASAGESKSSIAPIQQSLADISNKLATETTKKVSEEIRHAATIVEGNLDKLTGKLKVKDALNIRRKLGETYEGLSKNAKPYINDLRNSLNDYFAVYAAENPQFYKHLKEADKLTTMKHMQSVVDKFAQGIVNTVPGITGVLGKGAVKLVLAPTLGISEKITRNVATNSAARKHYFDVVKGAATQNPALFVNSLRKFETSTE